jgi:hypothetical protein
LGKEKRARPETADTDFSLNLDSRTGVHHIDDSGGYGRATVADPFFVTVHHVPEGDPMSYLNTLAKASFVTLAPGNQPS